MDGIVFDKNVFGSNRDVDSNGYLRVVDCNITKAQVAGYLGSEIPNWKNFNLERDKIYYVLRPEAELKKAVESFNNLPLTRKHIEVDVDNVPKEDIIGSLGDSAVFEDGYLKNNIIVYDQKYIDRIENGKQKELSCGYRYTPVRESGEYNGQHYDFVMKDIIGNHVALVKEGRAGHDVMVSDTIESVKDKIMGLFGKKQIVGDEFKESEHPRDKGGRFTDKGGESNGSKSGTSERKSDVSEFITWKTGIAPTGRKYTDFDFNYKGARISGMRDEDSKEWVHGTITAPDGKKMKGTKEDTWESFEVKEKDFDNYIKNIVKEDSFEDMDAETWKESVNRAKEKIEKEGKVKTIYAGGSEKESSSEGNKRDLTGHDVFLKMVRKPSNLDEVKKESRNNGTDKVKVVETIDLNEEDYEKLTKNPLRDYDFLKGKGGYDEEGNRTAVAIRTKGKPTLVIDPSGYSYARYMGVFYDNLEEENKDMANDSAEQEKVGVVMKEFKKGELKSGSGEKVTDPKQAIAIALSEADKVSDGQKKPETAGEGKADKEDDKMEEKKKESLAEDKCAKDEKVDKRKLIDEVGGILKGKVDEELWRTVIGKIEKIAYNDSEAGTTNDEDKIENKKDFAEGVVYGEEKEKEEPKKLDSEHESEGMKKFEEKKEAEDKCGKMAKDEMTFDINTIKAQVRKELVEDFKNREEARKAVKSTIGEINVMTFDSCEDIYKLACEKAGLNVNEIASYKDAFKGFSAGKSVKGGLALDATPKSSGNLEECLKDIRS